MNERTLAGATGTPNTMARLSAVLSLAVLLSACDGGPSTLTSPTPPPPPPTATVTYSLSGVVFEITEAGPVPIEDVELYCDSCGGPFGHTFVYTDANGFYSLAWSMNGVHPLYVRKAGYAIFDAALRDEYGRIHATVRGDTRFDIQLARR